MKTIKVKQVVEVEVEVKTLHVAAGVRYWEDNQVNGEDDDSDNPNLPCIEGDYWKPVIDVETGQILNWTKGVTASVHAKVCDDGIYALKDADDNVVSQLDGYVPSTLCPGESGYGDYIIMNIDENGFIQDWEFNAEEFEYSDDGD